MSAFDYVRPDGLYPPESVPGASDFQRFDVKQSKAVNADDGGTYNPTSPIMIGGGGVSFTTAGTTITGGVRTQTKGRIVLGTYDQIALSPPRFIKRTMTLLCVQPVAQTAGMGSGTAAYNSFGSPGGNNFQLEPDVYLTLVEPPAACGLYPARINTQLVIPIPGEYLANGTGMKLSAVTLNFRVLSAPASLPIPGQRMQIIPVNQMGPGDSDGPTGPGQLLVSSRFGFWAPSHVYTSGTYVEPFANATAPLSYFKVHTAGTSGSTEPTWNTTPGGFTTDGGVTWVCIGQVGIFYAPTTDAYYNAGAPQSLRLDLDLALAQTIFPDARTYDLLIYAPPGDASIVYHSLQFEFDDVTLMSWP